MQKLTKSGDNYWLCTEAPNKRGASSTGCKLLSKEDIINLISQYEETKE